MDNVTAISVAVVAGVGYLWYRRTKHQELTVKDYQAAFPTAQWVSAMRATDAASDSPMIGSNIGAGPDTLAETLSGPSGMDILDASVEAYRATKSSISMSLVARTMTFDAHWVAALDAGVKQFVILAAGLDARAWRLPRMDKSVKVFEVDVPLAHAYKAERIATLDAPLACSRIAVEADLSEPSWVDALLAAGFEPSQPSFFLIEGLLMYLPPGAPEALLSATAGLMSKGSTLTGDTFVGSLGLTDQSFVQSLGTKWTFEFATHDAVKAQLASVGLDGATVEAVDWQSGSQSGSQQVKPDDEAYPEDKAKKMQQVLLSMGMWPVGAKIMTVRNLIKKGEEGAKQLATQVVADKMNFHGLAEVDAATKTKIVELILTTPLKEPRQGTTSFVEALLAEAHEIGKGEDMQISLVRQWWTMGAFMFNMMRLAAKMRKGGGGSGTYVTYMVKKA